MDARQRRSRERLHQAVLRLAEERPVSQVSVSELAREAGVHRSTFYEHASSPDDLLRQALLVDLDALREPLLAETGADLAVVATEVTQGVMRHIEDHIAIYRRDLAYTSEVGLRSMLGSHFLESSRILLDLARVRIEMPVAGVPDDAAADIAARLVADGTVGAIAGWLERPDLSVDDFLSVYVQMLPSWWPLSVTTQS
ncbi:TetR/AcrR family transcriptional regulator [Kineosporia rhizophila]|uniref:TetR/AcrR family transcriptional regulator n=1 Tax=Kineosporia TaxID=49184 RepID=UPI001E51696B|nr:MULTISPECIES: TetR/AcrR family transcriptional regulator [Kineosporia]MCE0534990.1 TetR/AcrR family transcriptional regulator [Kineosporia rhizophila]GLY14726.1 TetR family transcriptional regulator [Kineosporia sp. NBRC 101677]